MKKTFILAVFTVLALFQIRAQEINQTIQIKKYTEISDNSLQLATDFADKIIIAPDKVKSIQGKSISRVELVYTAYRESRNFNQKALNDQRKSELIRLLPQLKTDHPDWIYVEQTGARDFAVAQSYFHGFVLHFENDLAYQELEQFFEEFRKEPEVYAVDNKEGATIKHESGTQIHIPKNAVTYADGTPVKGGYNLKYQEFRDAADIAYSGIPMTYDGKDGKYNFSSVGMYEIRADQDGKELQLNKAITVDFKANNQAEGVGFYQMNDETGEWEKLKDIQFEKPAEAKNVLKVQDDEKELIKGGVVEELEIMELSYSHYAEGKNMHITFRDSIWKELKKQLKNEPEWNEKIVYRNNSKQIIKVKKKDFKQFQGFIGQCWNACFANNPNWNQGNLNQEWDSRPNRKPVKNDMNATLLASGANAGHTYPSMVRGLNSSKFGVYNCDQIYRIGKSKSIRPQYVDAETGKPIKKKHVACVIDLTYNGSFSFDPAYLTCNLEGKNVILLFTQDKKTYMLDADQFTSSYAANNQQPVFRMKDMTHVLKSSNDLKRVLNL